MIEINLDEKEELIKIAKDVRPEILNNRRLYESIKPYDILIIFINSYNFLLDIKISLKNDLLRAKINIMMKNLYELYKRCCYLIYEMDKENIFSKNEALDESKILLLNNYNKMKEFNSFLYPLGKRVRQYDPDEYGGIIL